MQDQHRQQQAAISMVAADRRKVETVMFISSSLEPTTRSWRFSVW
jgi:hypothetical protein